MAAPHRRLRHCPHEEAYCTVQWTHHGIEGGVQLGKLLLRGAMSILGLLVHQAVDVHLQLLDAQVGVDALQQGTRQRSGHG